MNRMHEMFEQLTSSNIKIWSSTALKTFDNYFIIIPNNSVNIRIS